MDLMKEMGVLMMDQQLPQCILNDGAPEYAIINGNHHITTA
jgi:hypothetical protein